MKFPNRTRNSLKLEKRTNREKKNITEISIDYEIYHDKTMKRVAGNVKNKKRYRTNRKR